MSEEDDFAEELRGDEDSMSGNSKGNDWVASIVSGVIVGVIVAASSRIGNRTDDTRDTLIDLKRQVTTLVGEVQSLKNSPYIRREEFDREFSRLDARLGNIERAIQQRGQR